MIRTTLYIVIKIYVGIERASFTWADKIPRTRIKIGDKNLMIPHVAIVYGLRKSGSTFHT